MPKINLAQETIRSQILAKRKKMLYVFSVVVLVLVTAVYLTLFLITNNINQQAEGVKKNVKELDTQLAASEPTVKEIVSFRNRLASISDLIKGHVKWSAFFDELEKVSTTNSNYKGLKGNVENGSIEAVLELPNVNSAASMVASLENNAQNKTSFSDVRVVSISTQSSQTASVYKVSLKFTAGKNAFSGKTVVSTPIPEATPASEVQGTSNNPIIPEV